jgi:hypothetical protein
MSRLRLAAGGLSPCSRHHTTTASSLWDLRVQELELDVADGERPPPAERGRRHEPIAVDPALIERAPAQAGAREGDQAAQCFFTTAISSAMSTGFER